eukprot:CAMPEP_0204370850 /NCGR_PEP_ID=MMETSP0469-20131031/46056_1 /ASSEMBLY_ACC=CAM_ASM_000384 /TAXON_ID=2969 /ORGANISM="Oxyrrhis marina" /LENGTH=63 /DNA_ID=CAMNT_0051360845 /DNA_START=109 /DNA_END=297 /DNA_ORIENTATION=+
MVPRCAARWGLQLLGSIPAVPRPAEVQGPPRGSLHGTRRAGAAAPPSPRRQSVPEEAKRGHIW